MKVPVKDLTGKTVEEIELRDDVFGLKPKKAVIHQALVRQLADARQGTSDTKTRAEVSGGGKKPRPQKFSGRSRQGSIRSPLWRHGGIAFGPHQRDYHQDIPKKMRRLAVKGLLSSKVAEGELLVVNDLNTEGLNTKKMAGIMEAIGVYSSALVLTNGKSDESVVRAARNLKGVKALPATTLNVVDLLNYTQLVTSVAALKKAEELLSMPVNRKKGRVPVAVAAGGAKAKKLGAEANS